MPAKKPTAGIEIIRGCDGITKTTKYVLLINGQRVKARQTEMALLSCLYDDIGFIVSYERLCAVLGYGGQTRKTKHDLQQQIVRVKRILEKYNANCAVAVTHGTGYALSQMRTARGRRKSAPLTSDGRRSSTACGVTDHADILERWRLLNPYLDQRQQRLWAAAEAEVLGRGGNLLLSRIVGFSSNGISERRRKLRLSKSAPLGSLARVQRRGGSGRPPVEIRDPGIEPALERILSDEIAGDPMGRQMWMRSSIRQLSKRLKEQGHKIGHGAVARLLRKMGYSLQVMKKRQAGAQHPDRDEQFKYIAIMKAQFLHEGFPVISIDTKKKELIGNYRREGKSWRRKPTEVDSYFAGYARCVAVPFGIYDLAKNIGYVTVGISGNTSEFAVSCLANWWQHHGRSAYPRADRVLILADGGGGNGYNLRTWKNDLQETLCDDFGLNVTVIHYPPGCSKWNPVEYRLFSQISINWAGQPLRSLDLMLAYIRGTTTTTGLRVEARLDQEIYRKGRKVTERQLKTLALSAHDVCPRWNYTITARKN